MYRVVRARFHETALDMDFVSLQPRLADFKFLLGHPTTSTKQSRRQVFVQHKIDSRIPRPANDQLDAVRVTSRSD